jgi:hypothetical protein
VLRYLLLLFLSLSHLEEEYCCSNLFRDQYFSPFIVDDPCTYWTQPDELYNWWKLNIEKKSMYKSMHQNASYNGVDLPKAACARWCAAIIALVEAIVSYLHPNLIGSPELLHFGAGVLPYQLPSLFASTLNGASDPTPGHNPGNPPQLLLGKRPIKPVDGRRTKPTLALNTRLMANSQGTGFGGEDALPKQPVDWKEEVAKMKATLAHKRKLNREGSDNRDHKEQGDRNPFPLKLYDMVTEQNNEIIGWLPEGKAFKVRQMEYFENIILPTYFKRKFSLLTSTSLLYVSHE